MPLVETESLILRTYNLAEADKIVLMFTRDHGIVRGVAKGAKRLKSKFGSSLEPYSVVRIHYFQKETLELMSIQRIDLIDSYFAAASRPEFLNKFAYLTEILIASLPPHDPNETLYRMTKACLAAAEVDQTKLESIGLYFEIWLLKLTGYLPRWKNCTECGTEFGEAQAGGLAANHELICGNCRRLSSMQQIGPHARKLVSDALRLSPRDFCELDFEQSLLRELSQFCRRVISQTIGRPVQETHLFNTGMQVK